jgi:hypothetical protein
VSTLSTIPNVLVSETPEGLRQLMLENNIRMDAWVNYRWVQFVDGKWYAWYDSDVDKEMIAKQNEDKIKENSKDE